MCANKLETSSVYFFVLIFGLVQQGSGKNSFLSAKEKPNGAIEHYGFHYNAPLICMGNMLSDIISNSMEIKCKVKR